MLIVIIFLVLLGLGSFSTANHFEHVIQLVNRRMAPLKPILTLTASLVHFDHHVQVVVCHIDDLPEAF